MVRQELDLAEATAQELEALYREEGPGLSGSELCQRRARLGDLEVAPKAFQYRSDDVRPWEKQHHVESLARTITSHDRLLDPIELFPVAGHRVVLDGHCRLAAYREAGFESSQRVPVDFFEGSFREALLRAAAANSKDKLPLTSEEKLEAAWRLVLYDEESKCYSLRQIARATGTGKSTVGNMRKLLGAQDLGFDPRSLTWWRVKRERRGERTVDRDWKENLAQAWAGRLRDALGDKPNDISDCFFEALRLAYPQIIPGEIPFHWASESGALETLKELEDLSF